MHRVHALAAALVVLPASCAPAPTVDAGPDDAVDAGVESTAFVWRTIDADDEAAAVPPSWGAFVAAGTGDRAVRVGGSEGGFGPVVNRLVAVAPTRDGVTITEPATTDAPRFCGCAMLDEARGEVVVLGGRDASFADAETAAVIDLATGTTTPIEDSGAADHPVGCAAFFLPGPDKGYVFGGLSSSGGFSDATWRYDPDARTFTELVDVAGPAARYDAAVKVLDEETAIVATGMGQRFTGVKFFQDVWRFDGAAEAWTEVAATNDPPPGRRVPFFALAPDGDTVVLGYGSDAPRGDSVLADLWTFSLSTGAWTEAEVTGDAPTARGFAPMLPGPTGSVGLLVGGFDGTDLVGDAWVLDPPPALAGTWR